jgi:hypothetical protein
VTTVDSPTRPRSRDEFRELARALHAARFSPSWVPPDAFEHRAAPPVCTRFLDDALIRATAWLPQLIECQPRMNLKLLQPVEWPPESTLAAQVWRGCGCADRPQDAGAGAGVHQPVRAESGAVLPTIRLPAPTTISMNSAM